MKVGFKLSLSLILTYVSFYFIMRFILNVDKLIVKSFESLLFNVTNDELTLIILGLNTIFYSLVLFIALNSKSDVISTKLKFIENAFLGIIIIFLPYLYLLINSDLNDFFYNYTDLIFLLYISIYIFGILLFFYNSKSIINSLKKVFPFKFFIIK